VQKRLLCPIGLIAFLCLACVVHTGCAGISASLNSSDSQSGTSPKGDSTAATFSIAGSIGPSGNGSGIAVTLGGGSGAATTTDSNGNYSFSGLASGTYTIMPSKSGLNFSPASRSVTISASDATSQNFTASAIPSTFSISGTVSPSADGGGTTVTLGGAAEMTAATDTNGSYTFSNLATGSYTLTPSKSGYGFSPASQNVTITTANITGENFTAAANAPPPTFSVSGTLSPSTNGSGATLTISGAASATTTADSSGNYSFSGLPSGSYTVTPTKDGFSFTPNTESANVTSSNVMGENFTASENSSTSMFSIAGTITPTANGTGVTVTLGGSASLTATTDNNGNYTFNNLPIGNYTVTPSKTGFSFSPASLSETISTSNLTSANFSAGSAAPQTFSISGTVSPSANSAGAVVVLSGAASATTTVNSAGAYSFSGLASGSYTVTPSKTGFNFSPSSQSGTVSTANIKGVNFAAAQAPSGPPPVNIYPGNDIPTVVNAAPAGTTFVIYPGTYRLTQAIIPKNGDSFIGQTACAPPTTPCPVIISGSTVVGPLATFDGTNYAVGDQPQQGKTGAAGICDPGWPGCIYPEDLFFDGAPYQHLNSTALPIIGARQWWFDYPNHVIYFHDNPSGHFIETSVQPNAFGGAANNVSIQYLTVEEFASMYPTGAIGTSQGTTPQSTGANWTIQNCEVLLNHGYGVRIGYGVQILNNYIHDNGQNGIGGGIGTTTAPATSSMNSGVLIQGNIIKHNDYAHFSPGWGSGGVKVGATSGVTLRGNTIQNNEGAGIHFDMNSQNELVDGNTITDNTDADGLIQEIGFGTSTFRNNVVLRNGAQANDTNFSYQINVSSSAGVNEYCNVMEVSSGPGINGWGVSAANRGNSAYPPYQYLTTTGNSVHHNTVIWDASATGIVGFIQNDAANQPNFFANNTPPDFNMYHLPSPSAAEFIYDNNNTQRNTAQIFGTYQTAGADVHGTVDGNYTGGFPTVAITSPADQSSVGNPAAIMAAASDTSGIKQVEFYVDWVLQSTVTSAPYTYNWGSAPAGAHTVAAMAFSNVGIEACYAVTLNKN
jgi:parallel beta-helix repeat protein